MRQKKHILRYTIKPKDVIQIKTTVFGDILFIINFSMDFLSLYISGKILHLDMKKRRLLLSSAVGGVYGVASLFIQGALPSAVFNIAVYLLMCFTAYKNIVLSQYIKLCLLFYSVSLLMGGAVTASYSFIDSIMGNMWIGGTVTQAKKIPFYVFATVVILCAVTAYITGRIFAKSADIKDAYLTVVFEEKTVDMHVLIDSGNLLHEPLSGAPVILIKNEKFRKLTGCTSKTLLENERLLSKTRFIPAHSAGGDAMFYGIVPEQVYIGTKKEKVPMKAVIAVCDNTDFAQFDGVAPLCLYEIKN